MPKPEDILGKWRAFCPPRVEKRDFEKVLRHFLGRWLREHRGGSHLFVVEHPALEQVPAFRGYCTFSAVIEEGRHVRAIYVKHLIKAIDCILEYEGEDQL